MQMNYFFAHFLHSLLRQSTPFSHFRIHEQRNNSLRTHSHQSRAERKRRAVGKKSKYQRWWVDEIKASTTLSPNVRTFCRITFNQNGPNILEQSGRYTRACEVQQQRTGRNDVGRSRRGQVWTGGFTVESERAVHTVIETMAAIDTYCCRCACLLIHNKLRIYALRVPRDMQQCRAWGATM